MPKRLGKRYDYTFEEYLEIKKENKRKLDEIMAIPNYQEVLGKKYFGDNWRATLWGNHPARTEKKTENLKKAYAKKMGHEVEAYKPYTERRIAQLDVKTGEVVKEWDSAIQYCIENGINIKKASYISKIAREMGKSDAAYGYHWKIIE